MTIDLFNSFQRSYPISSKFYHLSTSDKLADYEKVPLFWELMSIFDNSRIFLTPSSSPKQQHSRKRSLQSPYNCRSFSKWSKISLISLKMPLKKAIPQTAMKTTQHCLDVDHNLAEYPKHQIIYCFFEVSKTKNVGSGSKFCQIHWNSNALISLEVCRFDVSKSCSETILRSQTLITRTRGFKSQ